MKIWTFCQILLASFPDCYKPLSVFSLEILRSEVFLHKLEQQSSCSGLCVPGQVGLRARTAFLTVPIE